LWLTEVTPPLAKAKRSTTNFSGAKKSTKSSTKQLAEKLRRTPVWRSQDRYFKEDISLAKPKEDSLSKVRVIYLASLITQIL
jgi:hypothetical protein